MKIEQPEGIFKEKHPEGIGKSDTIQGYDVIPQPIYTTVETEAHKRWKAARPMGIDPSYDVSTSNEPPPCNYESDGKNHADEAAYRRRLEELEEREKIVQYQEERLLDEREKLSDDYLFLVRPVDYEDAVFVNVSRTSEAIVNKLLSEKYLDLSDDDRLRLTDSIYDTIMSLEIKSKTINLEIEDDAIESECVKTECVKIEGADVTKYTEDDKILPHIDKWY